MPKSFKVIINGELQPPKKIDFTVMGLDYVTNDFLNWCMNNINNLEWIKSHDIMEVKSGNVILHFNDLKKICRSDRTFIDNS